MFHNVFHPFSNWRFCHWIHLTCHFAINLPIWVEVSTDLITQPEPIAYFKTDDLGANDLAGTANARHFSVTCDRPAVKEPLA
jgi:hypothetical protein